MKDIKGYEGLYAATKDGKIWSYPKRWKIGGGFFGDGTTRKGKFLVGGKKKTGYRSIILCNKQGVVKRRSIDIHRLIAETLIPNPLNLPQVNHKNGVRDDNRVENLEWVSYRENMRHAFFTNIKCPKCGHIIVYEETTSK